MSNTEWRVWSRLRSKQLAGFKFRRQFAIGPYFADFACVAARLVVEIDGPLHDEEADHRRDDYVQAQGFQVLRISIADVDETLDDVIETIYLKLESPHPAVACGQGRPPRRGGR